MEETKDLRKQIDFYNLNYYCKGEIIHYNRRLYKSEEEQKNLKMK